MLKVHCSVDESVLRVHEILCLFTRCWANSRLHYDKCVHSHPSIHSLTVSNITENKDKTTLSVVEVSNTLEDTSIGSKRLKGHEKWPLTITVATETKWSAPYPKSGY